MPLSLQQLPRSLSHTLKQLGDLQHCHRMKHLDVQRLGKRGPLLNEPEPRFRFGPHQCIDGTANFRAIIITKLNAQHHTLTRILRRFFQLLGVHLAESLEAANLDLLVRLEHAALQNTDRAPGRRVHRAFSSPGSA